MIKAFDTSSLATRSPVRREELLKLYADGFRLAIWRAFDGYRVDGVFREGLEVSLELGFAVAAYVVVLPRSRGSVMRNALLESAGRLLGRLQFVAIDVEVEGIKEEQILEYVAHLETLKVRPVIYTRKSFWEAQGFSNRFSYLPLWYAHYDWVASFDDFEPFAGWTEDKVVGKQYGNDVGYGGMTVDYNVFLDDVLRQDNVEEVKAIYTQLDAIWGYSLEIQRSVSAIKDHLEKLGLRDPRA